MFDKKQTDEISLELCSRGYGARYLTENLLHRPIDPGLGTVAEIDLKPFCLSNKMINLSYLEV